MRINLDYKMTEKEKGELTYSKFTQDLITAGVVNHYEKGLEGSMRRIWGRIQRKLDAAVEGNAEEVELEQAEIDFIKKAVESAKFDPRVAKFVAVLEEEIEKQKK